MVRRSGDRRKRSCRCLVGVGAKLNVATAPCPEKPARQILNLLRRKRRFAQMEVLGDAFIRSGQSAPQILRQYAQAMIDVGNFTASRLVLKSIVDDPLSPSAEKAEASGLLGRIYKQLYVNAGDPSSPRQRENLKQAIEYYFHVYASPGGFNRGSRGKSAAEHSAGSSPQKVQRSFWITTRSNWTPCTTRRLTRPTRLRSSSAMPVTAMLPDLGPPTSSRLSTLSKTSNCSTGF